MSDQTPLPNNEETLRGVRGGEADTLVVGATRFCDEILAQISDAVVAVDDENRVTYLNAAAERQYGVASSKALGGCLTDLYISRWLRPEDESLAATALREVGHWRGESIHTKRSGETIHVESSVTRLQGKEAAYSGLLSVFRDLTERQQNQEDLRASEDRYRSLFENNLDSLFTVDSTGRFLTVNPAAEALCGYSSDELLSMTFAELCVPEYLEQTMATFVSSLHGRQPGIETAMVRKNGRRVELFVTGIPVKTNGVTVALFCIARDITLPKRTEQERAITVELLNLVNSSNSTRGLLQEVTAFFQRCFDCDAVGIRLCEGEDFPYFETRGLTKEFVALENSLCASDCSGCIQRDAGGDAILECICGSVLRNRCEFTECLTARGSFWTADMLHFAKTLSENTRSQLRGRCFTDAYRSLAFIPLGRSDHRIGLLQLSSRKRGYFNWRLMSLWERLAEKLSIAIAKFQAEDRLKEAHDKLERKVRERTSELQAAYSALTESEERFRQMAENVREVFYLMDVGEPRLLYVSPAYEQIWGRSCQDLAANPRSWLEAVHPDDREQVARAFDSVGKLGVPVSFEYRIILPDGSVRWIFEHGSPVRDETGCVHRIAGVARDVTVRKDAEIALQRANRALLMLQQCDEVLARASSESELLKQICQIILQIEGIKMAWVGFAENDEQKSVRPVAYAGAKKADMDSAGITWADEPRGRGPTGTAIRTREVVVCQDMSQNPGLAPWRTKQLRHGYAALIALPLVWKEECLGALSIFSGRLNAFNAQEVALLEQLALDVSNGIVALRTRSAHEQLQQELLGTSEREKQLIAQELHDGLCQNLAGTAFMSSTLQFRLAKNKEPNAKLAGEICSLLSTAVNEARNLSHGLHPVGPEGEGLMNALSQLAGTVRNLFHIQCTFRCPEPVLLENETISTHLFRITQEALNNARKHGEADRVVIGLRKIHGGLTLTIRDNGIGIPAKLPRRSGMGLGIMKHRAAEIGATLSVRRGSKCGTVVTCTVPVAG